MKRFFFRFSSDFESLATSPKKQSVSLFSVLFLVLILSSCTSYRKVAVAEHSTHDTLYLNKVMYDSIYVDNRQVIDRTKDTILIREILREYKYQFLKDTVRVVRVDSIPVIREVQVTKTVKTVPGFYKACLWFSVIVIVIAIVYILIRVISKIRVL